MKSWSFSQSLLFPSVRAHQFSAWHGHVSFAHWIIENLRPKTVVELGSHNGLSYFAFCNAINHLGLNTKAFAVDTWEGDVHAGAYENSTFEDVSDFNSWNYSDFSTLKRMFFADAAKDFADGSIDLLHIDGLHTYEAVKEDYETWKPKLSNRAVVLFHDTAVRGESWGVWKLWEELTSNIPGFNFHHSAGLGVLCYGNDVPEAVQGLCALGDSSKDAQHARDVFERCSKIAYHQGLGTNFPSEDAVRTNVALHCQASQSSFIETRSPTPQGAVNGIKNGRYGFTTRYENRPWWKLDLGEQVAIGEIRVFNRIESNCATRASNIEISVSNDDLDWSTIHRQGGVQFGGIEGNPLVVRPVGANARYVLLRLADTNFLHLDEVEVYRAN
jgi:predicted O-methyltransferase YrrM